MSTVDYIFPTTIYKSSLNVDQQAAAIDELRIACRALEQEDTEGQSWADNSSYAGYTSFGSISDLAERNETFQKLCGWLAPHLSEFSQILEFDVDGLRPEIDSIWINILRPGGSHPSHIHANSVISGTVYVDVPDGTSPLRFEDPKIAMLMAAPPRKACCSLTNRKYVSFAPSPGTVILWESWLRHEVPVNRSNEDRISISFNVVMIPTEA